jgi:tetratricopeptide (TPR) repeat protein/predicted Ser/Thr protein kinase
MPFLSQPIQRAREFIGSTPLVDQVLQSIVLLALLYGLYRFLMGPRGSKIRKKFPILGFWQARMEVRDLIQSGEYAKAGDRLVQIGELEHAIKVFQEGNLFGRAADVYLKQRKPDRAALMYERAGDFAKAAEIYLERKQYDRAELSLEKVGKLEELGDLFLSRDEFILAAKAYLRSKKYLEAGTAWNRAGKSAEASEAYRKAFAVAKETAGEWISETPPPEMERIGGMAAVQLEKAGEFVKAAEIYLEIKKPKEAARCYGEGKDHFHAAELFEQAGKLEEAASQWRLAGNPKTAARLEGERLFQTGQPTEAIAKFVEAGEYSRAAEVHIELNEPLQAAALYEKGNAFSSAASLYREAGKLEEAGIAFEKAKDFQEAVDCYRKAALPDREADLLKRLGDFLALAELFRQRGEEDSALEYLTQIDPKDPNYRKALSVKGKILLERGDSLGAKECLDRAVSMAQRLDGDDVDALYNLAVIADRTQTETNALQILERALIQNLVEKGAVEKAENVRKVLTEKAVTRMSRMVPLHGGGTGIAGVAPQPAIPSAAQQRYIPIKEIGRGGMGIVYTARDATLDRTVALKILPESLQTNERAISTFLREAKAAAALNHPNIVIVHDTGMQNSQYYIAMEYIEGRTIKEILRKRKKLSLASVREVVRQLLSALAYAHSKKVVHRDLTTNNIMWTQQKSVKIMDFGLAKVITELQSEQSIVGGTPSFMSPEQTLGKPIDHRTDVYSLGICIYEMLLGALPFIGGDLGYHHLHTPPPDPKTKDPSIPEDFRRVILRCMQKDPNERYQSIAEIREILDRAT